MGLDGVELVMELEERFQIAIPDADAADLRTPRNVIDYIYKRVTHASDPTCLTQRAFYRVRQALIQVLGIPRGTIVRDARLEHLVPRQRRRALWKALADASKVPAWPPLTRPPWITVLVTASSITMGMGLAAITDSGVLLPSLGAIAALTLGILATKPLRFSVARQWPTVGGVAQYLAVHAPAALLTPTPAWTRDQVRQVVRATIADELGISPDFDDSAQFVRDLGVD